MYQAETRSIVISVSPKYLEDQSDPETGHYVWTYHVKIENRGQEGVQLRSRHWRITDTTGICHEVRGPGVVGVEPVIQPGEVFEYTSGTPLSTPSGLMFGTYQMETVSGERFDAVIPAFSLDSPHQPMRPN